MISIYTYAAILLVMRLIGTALIGSVFAKQIALFKKPAIRPVQLIRIILFAASLIILITNTIPLVIDVMTLVGAVERSTNMVNLTGLVYTMTWSTGYLSLCLAFVLLYWFAATRNEV